ncbi:MAG: HNH endonuclease, partial [Actinomycetota bacterium]
DEAINAALIGHVRRVVYDTQGVVTDLGRRARLFTGAAREAVMLLETECAWAGCDRPVAWCDADHSQSWAAHGATVPRNGAPLCRAHNLHKERGYRVHRDPDGNWHTHHPDGTEIN